MDATTKETLNRIAAWVRSHGNDATVLADGCVRIVSIWTTSDGGEGCFFDYVRTYAEARAVLGY